LLYKHSISLHKNIYISVTQETSKLVTTEYFKSQKAKTFSSFLLRTCSALRSISILSFGLSIIKYFKQKFKKKNKFIFKFMNSRSFETYYLFSHAFKIGKNQET